MLARALLFVWLTAVPAYADTIILDPGPQGPSPFLFLIPFDNLNGTPIVGQTLSLSFMFADEKYIVVNRGGLTSGPWIELVTDTVFPAGMTGLTGVASVLDINGQPFATAAIRPLSTGPTNTMTGLFGVPIINTTYGFYGAQYEIPLPPLTDVTIVGARLRIAGSEWITVPELPAVWLLAFGLVVLMLASKGAGRTNSNIPGRFIARPSANRKAVARSRYTLRSRSFPASQLERRITDLMVRKALFTLVRVDS